MPGITKEDIEDVEIVDAEELIADGSSSYLSGVSVTSTTTGSRVVTFPAGTNLPLTDDPVEVGDAIILAGTSGGADGPYTVESVNNDDLVVVEAIPSSTGGTAAFRHPPGAVKVGVDPSNLTFSAQSNLQGVLEDIDTGLSSGHKDLRHLIHFIDGGPAGGFASGAFMETLPAADPFHTSEIWWESAAKLQKIVELTITRDAQQKPTTEVWKMYDTDGTTVLETVTDAISYTGPFETSRTRTIA